MPICDYNSPEAERAHRVVEILEVLMKVRPTVLDSLRDTCYGSRMGIKPWVG